MSKLNLASSSTQDKLGNRKMSWETNGIRYYNNHFTHQVSFGSLNIWAPTPWNY